MMASGCAPEMKRMRGVLCNSLLFKDHEIVEDISSHLNHDEGLSDTVKSSKACRVPSRRGLSASMGEVSSEVPWVYGI